MGIRAILVSGAALMASQVGTAAIGFLFWVAAARRFDETAVGLSSAAISAMSLLGAVATIGMGTLLIREMPRNPGREHKMLTAALILSGGLGSVLGLIFVVIAPAISAEFAPMASDLVIAASVIIGSGLTAAALNMDQALIGLLHPGLQLLRNIVAAAGRVILLAATIIAGFGAGSAAMLGSWSLALGLSLAVLALLAIRRGRFRDAFPPAWGVLHGLRGAAVQHHLLNLAIQLPGWIVPLITLTVLSAATNARFYLAWLLVGLASFVPVALTWALYASSSRDRASMAKNVRITLALSFGAAAISITVLWLWGEQILSLLGPTYVQAAEPLRILSLTLIPSVIKAHFVTIHRVHGTLTMATFVVAVAGLLEVSASAIGATLGGLTGLSVGLLVAMAAEAVVMLPSVYGATVMPRPTTAPATGDRS